VSVPVPVNDRVLGARNGNRLRARLYVPALSPGWCVRGGWPAASRLSHPHRPPRRRARGARAYTPRRLRRGPRGTARV